MSEQTNDRRQFSRGTIDLPVEVRQGGSVWHQRLIDLSVAGLATDQPDTWDAQYNAPFTLVVRLTDGRTLTLHAYLQHVEAGRLGFAVRQVDPVNLAPLRALLASRVDDPSALDLEIQRLAQGESGD